MHVLSSISTAMAGWGYKNQKVMGIDMMQNCDLPPPNKVFSGSDMVVLSSMNHRICSEDEDDQKLELLKALRLSQTRAREAEKKAERLAKERDFLSNALAEESMKMYAFRQWVRVLELQVWKMKSEWEKQENGGSGGGGGGGGVTWLMALAVCVGLAGVGFAFGYKYLF